MKTKNAPIAQPAPLNTESAAGAFSFSHRALFRVGMARAFLSPLRRWGLGVKNRASKSPRPEVTKNRISGAGKSTSETRVACCGFSSRVLGPGGQGARPNDGFTEGTRDVAHRER